MRLIHIDAIDREKKAGVPINQIRVNQSGGKLRNAQNPDGLAVTNTRDEPTGRIPNFARGGGDNFFWRFDWCCLCFYNWRWVHC